MHTAPWFRAAYLRQFEWSECEIEKTHPWLCQVLWSCPKSVWVRGFVNHNSYSERENNHSAYSTRQKRLRFNLVRDNHDTFWTYRCTSIGKRSCSACMHQADLTRLPSSRGWLLIKCSFVTNFNRPSASRFFGVTIPRFPSQCWASSSLSWVPEMRHGIRLWLHCKRRVPKGAIVNALACVLKSEAGTSTQD